MAIVFRRTWCAVSLVSFCSIAAFGADQLYKQVSEVSIADRVVHLSVDEQDHRLYVVGERGIKTINVSSRQVEAYTNVNGATAFLPVGRFNLGYCLLPDENKLGMFELKGLGLKTKPQTGKTPAFTVYNSKSFQFYTFNTGDNSISPFEADDGDLMGSISLPGKPLGGAVDFKTSLLYCSIAGSTKILVINPLSRKVDKQIAMVAGHEPGPLCIDVEKHLLFAGCSNKVLAMMDLTSGQMLGSVPLGSVPDQLVHDAFLSIVVATDHEGVTIAREKRGELIVAQHLSTPGKVSAIAVDPVTHNLYISCSKNTPEQGEKAVAESSVLVFGAKTFQTTK